MKKIIVSLCCIFAATLLFAEVAEVKSIESEVTQETFGNEIDDSFNAGTGFGDYDQHFIFGGLGNPGKIGAESSGGEFKFGYYMPWKFPMSFFGVVKAGSTHNTKYKTDAKTYNKHTNQYPHDDIQTQTVTEYQRLPLFKTVDGGFNYLIGFSAGRKYVTGILFNFSSDTSAWTAADNAKVTVSEKNGGSLEKKSEITRKNFSADTVPLVVGYNLATASLSKPKTTKFDMRIPFAFATGAMEHTFGLDLTLNLKATKGSLAAWSKNFATRVETTEKASVTGKENTLTTALKYDFSMPAGESRPDDRWKAGAKIGFTHTGKSEKAEASKTDTTTGAALNATHSSENTYRSGYGFDITLEGGRLFSFASAQKAVLFNLQPTLKLSLQGGRGAQLEKSTVSNKSTLGSTTTYDRKTVTTYYKQDVTKNNTVFSTTVSVPMGLELRPANWKIGFLLGATPELTYTVTGVHKSHSGSNKTETTGTTSNISSEPGETETGGRASMSWTASEKHKIGITIPFEGGAHLDAELGGSLLEIKTFKIQAFIPLGSGKKAAAAADTSAPAPAETAAE